MLNAERFKDDLRAFYKSNKSYFALRKDSGLFCNCGNCVFDSIEACSYARLKSLLSEYEEKIKLTKFEHDILKYLADNTKHMYITRNKNGNLYIFDIEPRKSKADDLWTGRGTSWFGVFNKLFQFVKWEDSTPTSIKDVLENCEVVEDASN